MTFQPTVIAAALAAAIVIALSATHRPLAQDTPPVPAETAAPARTVTPGDVLRASEVDFIERPGHYGLGADLRGSRYAIIDGHLVRIDPDSLRVQSVLRDDVVAVD